MLHDEPLWGQSHPCPCCPDQAGRESKDLQGDALTPELSMLIVGTAIIGVARPSKATLYFTHV